MEYFNFNKKLIDLEKKAEKELKNYFKCAEDICEKNSKKVLSAFIKNRINYSHFEEINGYGFFDGGRDKMEAVFATVFGAEDALVRPQIMSGTNAIYLTLSGLLHYGDTLISITGTPYDPLRNIIGTDGNSVHSLINNGIKYEQIELINNDFDYNSITERIKNGNVKLIEIQRSRGYSHREGMSIAQIEKICKLIKEIDENIIIMVDNCYGELVEEKEPTEVGADVCCGSLMHNIGGGIATSGGYIVGKEKLIYEIAERLTAPCIAKELGANYNQINKILRGLFMAPQTVCNAVKTSIFSSFIFEKLGYTDVSPTYSKKRSDIVQTISFYNKNDLINFCKGIQNCSPVDSEFTPIPSEFPGYPHEEIMACGSFTNGSTIELSCDGPVIEPYTAYIQGGLTYYYGKIAILSGLNEVLKNKN